MTEPQGYVPTTMHVREMATHEERGDYHLAMAGADFDRWLEVHDREVAERAFQRCADDVNETVGYEMVDYNPYRANQLEGGK